MNTSQQRRRQRWLSDFEKLVVDQAPRFAGKIDWDTATYYWLRGRAPDEAARLYVSSEGPVERRY